METLDEIKQIDLKEYAQKYYGISSNEKGFACCPDHPPDNHPSLQFWIGNEGVQRYTDHHTKETGTIIDFVMMREHCTTPEAINRIKGNEEFEGGPEKKGHGIEYYPYKNYDNKVVYRKAKKDIGNGKKMFWFEHRRNGEWAKGKGNSELIPYNLPASTKFQNAFICEGEKDADTVKGVADELGLDYWITSAPNGMGAWPDSLNIFFSDFKEVVFLYDVGEKADKNVKEHAAVLIESLPDAKIFIAKVPLDEDGADITDYLNQEADKGMALLDILSHVEKFKMETENPIKYDNELKIETLEEFMSKQIPEIERLVDPYIERYGYTLVGGTKGVGKSLFVTQMALSYASGKLQFLRGTIESPGKVLLIQQEVSKSGMQDRLRKMIAEADFSPEGRFYPLTTTGGQLDLTKDIDRKKVFEFVDELEPDVLILDPLYTFFPGELNQSKDMSRIVSVLMELKSKHNLSLVVVHHFSNKRNPDEPVPTTGRFMGHSNLANAADVTIGIDFLHPKYKDQVLSLPYNHYASVETTTRHGEWPAKYFIERGPEKLTFCISSIWDELGKKVPPDEIIEFVNACGGEKPLKDVLAYFEKTKEAHPNTTRKSIKEAISMGKLDKKPIPGTHNMKMLVATNQGV